jgi:sulfate permease, SulP family
MKKLVPGVSILEGVLPIDKQRVPAEALAGITLAALAIPEVMGYSNIAGMPVVTGLYTLLLPTLAFALLGSSRHLVVGADSATAAVMAAGLAGLAATGSSEYVALAGLLALMAGLLMIAARLIHLGFIADFLSRTVLIGFLTGVGIQVAMGQLAGLLGVSDPGGRTIQKFIDTVKEIPDASVTTMAVSGAVIVTILGTKFVTKKVPGALIAVVGSIAVSYWADLSDHGVSTLGKVPSGLPSLTFPSDISWTDVGELIPTALSIFVLILAQSAATSRAYAAKYGDAFSENTDLIGLGFANFGACFTGTFVVNGSPTKTQMVDGAGGRSQLAQLTMGVVVVIVVLFLTAPLQYMPNAVLAAVVFLIGIELVDVLGMRKVLSVRPDEFVVAALTALTVIVIGVEQGIVLAILASIIDHLRKSYRPNRAVYHPSEIPEWSPITDSADERTQPGLVVYRFSADLYYANANTLFEDVTKFVQSSGETPLRVLCIEAEVMFDIDYTGADSLQRLHEECVANDVRLVMSSVPSTTRAELDRFGITELIGADGFYAHVDDVVAAFGTEQPSA